MTLALGPARHLSLALGALLAFAASALLLTACAGGTGGATGSGAGIIVGAVGPAPALDPAGPSAEGSLALQAQLFGRLITTDPGTGELKPDLAESAAFTAPTAYTVRLRPGQRFANGDALTSSDVKFSFDRQRAIAGPDGSAQQLGKLLSISTPDPGTVVFHLKTAADQAFARILASPVGAIVDEQIFSATKPTPNPVIVRAEAFDGQYRVDSYHPTLITLVPNARYGGSLGAPKASSISLKIYSRSAAARLDLHAGTIDIAYGLSPGDVALAGTDKGLRVRRAPGDETRFLVFNLNTMPYGATQDAADARKALAVRQAVADLIDRRALSKSAHSDTALPLYSVVPLGQADATGAFAAQYGDGQGGPDATKARALLDDAGIPTPVALTLHFTPSQFGASSAEEYTQLRTQLEDAGLFTIKLQSSEYPQFTKDVAADAYAAYQGDHVAAVADPSDSLALFGAGDPLSNHFTDPFLSAEIDKAMVEPDAAARAALIGELQLQLAAAVPVIPLLQSEQIAVTSTSISGVTFDARSGLRFGQLLRSAR